MEQPPKSQEAINQEKAKQYANSLLAKSRRERDELQSSIDYYVKRYYVKSKPASTSGPNSEPVGDGGMDIQDSEVEMGSARHEEDQYHHFTSPEILEKFEDLEREVEILEEDLENIEKGDKPTIDRYLARELFS